MRRAVTLIVCVLAAASVRAGNDDYAAMLGYLANSRIDGNALRGATGASAVNLSAGDLNQQANLRAFASGGRAQIQALQLQSDNQADRPRAASASIGGNAYVGGSGLASINQASGSGNAQLNAVSAELASQGIRETTDGALSAAVSASAGGQQVGNTAAPGGSMRSVAVESSAMRGYQGVLQLNQAAGSGNATGNQLVLSLPATPR
ncbi:hypothetical protein ACQVBX_16900 [Dyella sp. KULCS107]|uniref:hypothetical protein n=1 Tax=Dyella sp. KULCS107 TaxID=3422216 RepID=UPI003D6DD7C7